MIWQPEFTDKTLSRKPGAVHIRQLKLDIFTKSRLRIKVIADVPDSRRRDLDNILKGLLDSLIHAGFAEDDEQFDDIRVIRGVKVPGGRLGIKITELENA